MRKQGTSNLLLPDVSPIDNYRGVHIRLSHGWSAGETYELVLEPTLADARGNAWNRTLTVRFEVAATQIIDGLPLDGVNDMGRLGSLLFVAADHDGLVLVDASNPKWVPGVVRQGKPGIGGSDVDVSHQSGNRS
ncbi:MAG: hypothetical protein K8J08_00380 [Thermoanaerobaculia bacterium]|nr:hypothetical protein [Thermoanaerobaculia bacterium]